MQFLKRTGISIHALDAFARQARTAVERVSAAIRSRPSSTRLSSGERARFIKRLAYLTGAGMPLHEALALIARQEALRRRARVYAAIATAVGSGRPLHLALKRHRFELFVIAVVLVAERGGALPERLRYLADELDKRLRLHRALVGALLYPAIIALFALGIVALLIAYIFPKLEPVFRGLDAQLPLPTRVLIGASQFLTADWWIIFLVATAAIAGGLFVRSRYEGARRASDRLALALPLVGPLLQSHALGDACRSAGLLIAASESAPAALFVAAETARNAAYRAAFGEVARRTENGQDIASALRHFPALFPDTLADLVAVGERTGALQDTFQYLARQYELEADERTKTLGSALEPALMVAIGLIVGFVAVSIITPIYGITQDLQIN